MTEHGRDHRRDPVSTIAWWLSCSKFTVLVITDLDGGILDTAPVTAKFTGQSLSDLHRWAGKFGDVEVQEL